MVSVEPQTDLAAANKATTEHNCWQHRVENVAGFVTLSADEDKHDHTASRLWRPGMKDFEKKRGTTKVYLGRLIEQLGSKHLDLVKMIRLFLVLNIKLKLSFSYYPFSV